jgi:beta-galactosidase
MGKLLLLTLLLSKDTIITNLVKGYPASASPGAGIPSITLRILSSSPTAIRNISLQWSLQINGTSMNKGTTPIPLLAPNKPALLRLPLRLPDDTAGEAYLQLRYSSPSTPLADQQILLKPWRPRLSVTAAGKMDFSDENDLFTIHSPSIRISFNRQTGWLMHYEIKGINLLEGTLALRSNFWWPGYNDSANVYADSGWLAATRSPHLQLFSNTTSPELIIVRTEYTLPSTSCLLHLSYTINAGGEMLVTQQVEPDTSQLPTRSWPLPCFGMQWTLPPGFDSITAYGPIPVSVVPVLFHDHPIQPLPSDSNVRGAATRTDIRWWTITDKEGNGLRFIADTALLNESALYAGESDLTAKSHHPDIFPLVQLNIDRPAPHTLLRPDLLPIGNYRYAYKVKPLVYSTPVNNSHPIAN